MIKKILITSLLTVAFSIISCNSDDSNPIQQENPFKKFQGEWKGIYSGDGTNGIWTATIDDKGKAIGTLSSNSGNSSFDLEGNVTENGKLNAEYTNGSQVIGTMIGTMNETTASGTWSSPILQVEGTWSGNKN